MKNDPEQRADSAGERQPDASLARRIAENLPELERHVRRRLGPGLAAKESASDIVQSTARELLRSGRFEDRGGESMKRWLRKAAENKIRNRLRYWRALGRERDEEAVAVDAIVRSPGPRPSQDAMFREESTRLEAAIARLGDEHARVVRRVQFEGASYQTVAEETGRTPEAVRKLLARALGRLSSFLREPET